MRSLAVALVLALALASSPRVALAECPGDPGCDSTSTDAAAPDSPPTVDADGQPIPYVQETDAPAPGVALVDGNIY